MNNKFDTKEREVLNHHECASLSDAGNIRDHNEDAYYSSPENGLWVVADGMGGHAGGEIASRITIETISQAIGQGATLEVAVGKAHQAILDAVQNGKGKTGMGSTIVALQIKDSNYKIAWVGDSRAYLWNGKLKQLTRDHTYVQQLLESGAITMEEAQYHPEKSVLSRALGAPEFATAPVETITGQLFRNQKIVLCSDGLTGEVEDSEMNRILKKYQKNEIAVEQLVQKAKQNGGSDNITVIIVSASQNALEKPKRRVTEIIDVLALNRKIARKQFFKRFLWIILALLILIGLFVWGYHSLAGKKQPVMQSGGSMIEQKPDLQPRPSPGSEAENNDTQEAKDVSVDKIDSSYILPENEDTDGQSQ